MVLHKTPKNSKNLKNHDVFLQSSMGCLGQVTKLFGHFFRVVTGRFVIYRLQALKWYQETLATHGVQPTCQNPDLASRLLEETLTFLCVPRMSPGMKVMLLNLILSARRVSIMKLKKNTETSKFTSVLSTVNRPEGWLKALMQCNSTRQHVNGLLYSGAIALNKQRTRNKRKEKKS